MKRVVMWIMWIMWKSKNVNDYWKLEKQRFGAKNIEFMLRKLSNYVK